MPMPRFPRKVLTLLPVMLLCGCGDDAEKAPDSGSASGKILERSISDEMLPLDRLRSQAPPLEVASETKQEDSDSDAGGSSEELAAAGEAAGEATQDDSGGQAVENVSGAVSE